MIHRIAFIGYKGLKGRLIWDHDLWENELTFIENRTGKHFSLGKNMNDKEMDAVFSYLVHTYGEKGYKCICDILIVYETEKAKEAAKKLYKYICLKKKLTAVWLHGKEYEYLEKERQIKAEKEIILGHDSLANKIKKNVEGVQKIDLGMQIGYIL